MGKIKIVIVMLIVWLFAIDSFAISGRLDSLRAEVFGHLGLNRTTGAGIANVNLATSEININQTKVCKHFPVLEKLDTVIFTPGQDGAALNSDFNRIIDCYRMVGTNVRIPLEFKISNDSLYKIRGGWQGSVAQQTGYQDPRYYKTVGKRLMLWPPSMKAVTVKDSFLVSYFALAPDLTTDAETTLVGQEYRDYLIYLTCAKIEIARGNAQAARDWASLVPGGIGIIFKEDEGKK